MTQEKSTTAEIGVRQRKRITEPKSVWNKNESSGQFKAIENVFLAMQLRKMDRALTGTKSRNKSYEFIALAVMLVLIYSAGSATNEEELLNSDTFVSLSFNQVIMIGVWLFVANVVASVFRESKFIELLYWIVIYLPLLFIVTGLVILWGDNAILTYLLIAAEILAVCIFFSIYWLYPHILNSSWFRSNGRTPYYFGVKLVDDWTMTYTRRKGRCWLGKRHTCKYSGEVNDAGEPHGLGRWYDDAPDGEILTGSWRDGVPVAPFVSRKYGNGDTFRAVRVAYIKASDDVFDGTKWWPTNEIPIQCGMASVECSVSGSFYNDLPRAENLFEPYEFNENSSIGELIDTLPKLHDKELLHRLQIRADNPRGVQVENHVFSSSGRAVQKVDEIVVRVKAGKTMKSRESQIREFMPISPDFGKEKILVRTEEKDDMGEVSNDQNTFTSQQTSRANNTASSDTWTANEGDLEEGTRRNAIRFSLEVDGWERSKQKDVLVFVPGFNCSLKAALENFGQLIAMTKLDSHVYPILYNWPCGQVLTYHSASRASFSDKNRANFSRFLKGLQKAGVRNVHLMSHSMGVQTLLGSLIDKEDGSRSESSMCFQLASDCDDADSSPNIVVENGDTHLLACLTVTLLNPDFPLVPFQYHAFRSVRRLCKTVTVVGDKNDGALFFSQTVNGVAVRLGYKQPDSLLPNDRNKAKLMELLTVGKRIDSLYFPVEVLSKNGIPQHDFLLFKNDSPLVLRSNDDIVHDKFWMDLDVIDTTGLDTNIAEIRHSAYNLNPSLLRDLEELVTTGKRAVDRSLLYREGNIFSYANAPSFVSM